MTSKAEAKRFPGPPEPDLPEPPEHVSETMRAWWRELTEMYFVPPHHLKNLRRACEAWDIGEAARLQLENDGPTVTDRFGQVKPHPAASIWKDNAGLFQRLVRELGLDKLPGDPRPPRLY